MRSLVEVVAPSRLHFGMFSFGQAGRRAFGGVGAMIDEPGVSLRLTPSERFAASGPLALRVTAVVERVARLLELDEPPACHIEVVHAAAEHVGLGTGTQAALAVAAALHAWLDGTPLDATALAALAGRGERSAIGTYGFQRGGLLVERGKLAGELLSPLAERLELPAEWRFVVCWPSGERGLSGEAERAAFRALPPIPPATTARLEAEVFDTLLPAARAGQFDQFGESLWRFGHEAGLCFAAEQGGAFARPSIAQLVEWLRGEGVRGVGQSSWGPAVFALCHSPADGEQLAQTLRNRLASGHEVLVARPNQAGARVRRCELP